jgi:hypothetical protein
LGGGWELALRMAVIVTEISRTEDSERGSEDS